MSTVRNILVDTIMAPLNVSMRNNIDFTVLDIVSINASTSVIGIVGNGEVELAVRNLIKEMISWKN